MDSIELTKEAIQKFKNDIPAIYLTECEWFEQLLNEEVSPEDILRIHRTNMKRAKDCYIIHNALVRLLRIR